MFDSLPNTTTANDKGKSMFGQFANPEFSSETVWGGYFSLSFQAIEPL